MRKTKPAKSLKTRAFLGRVLKMCCCLHFNRIMTFVKLFYLMDYKNKQYILLRYINDTEMSAITNPSNYSGRVNFQFCWWVKTWNDVRT